MLSLKAATCASLIFFLFNLYLATRSIHQVPKHEIRETSEQEMKDLVPLNDIRNGTLGFQKIFVVNLQHRADRKDAMILAAAFTELKLDWINGLAGSEVAQVVVPTQQGTPSPGEGSKGSWRAHLNAIQGIVENRLGSALILEDDLDWDLRLKNQMEDFGRGVRRLTQPLEGSDSSVYADTSYITPRPNSERSEFSLSDDLNTVPPKVSPYGDDWDILWLGHCGMGIPDERPEANYHAKGVVTNAPDETVPAREKLFPEASYSFLPINYPSHTRLYHHAFIPTCSFAYAVSQRGARKILYELSVNKYTSEYDNMLRELCDGERGRDSKLVCMTTQPALFTHWRSHGSQKQDSDIAATEDAWRDRGESRDIRWSVRLNMERWVKGNKGEWLDQYPD